MGHTLEILKKGLFFQHGYFLWEYPVLFSEISLNLTPLHAEWDENHFDRTNEKFVSSTIF